MPRLLPTALAATAVVALICGCGDKGVESGRGEARPDLAPPTLTPVRLLPPHLSKDLLKRVEVRNPNALPTTQVDLFKQGPGRVDILWVIDDSGSMKNQRATLGGNFDRFLQELEAVQSNYQIGVISTNAEDEGKLIGQTVKIITNNTPDKRNVFLANTTFPDSRARW